MNHRHSKTRAAGSTTVASPQTAIERRAASRASDALDWESKALARVSEHVRTAPAQDDRLGWEQTVLDVLRKRIERGPQ